MTIKRFSLLLLVAGFLIMSTASFAQTAKQINAPKIKIERPQRHSMSSQYAELNKAIKDMNTGSLNSFKQSLKRAFKEIAQILPNIMPRGGKPSFSSLGHISKIERIVYKINGDKTSAEVIADEKEGINSTILALKAINNKAPNKFPDLESKLKEIQALKNEIKTPDYQEESVAVMKKLASTMQEMSTYYYEAQKQKKQ